MIIAISGKIGSGKDTVGNIIQTLVMENYQEKETSFLERNNWEIKKFAFKLKQVCSLILGTPVEMFERQEYKDSILDNQWNTFLGTTPTGPDLTKQSKAYESITVRIFMQKVGTEAMRDHVHTNVWVNALFSDYKCLCQCDKIRQNDVEVGCFACTGKQCPNWIITDLRFPNELETVKEKKGITIRINRKFYPTTKIGDINITSAISGMDEHPSETSLDHITDWDYVIDNSGTIEELVEKVRQILIREKIIN